MRSSVVLLTLLLAGCAESQYPPAMPSALQRYQALKRRLNTVTALSVRLSLDSRGVATLVRNDSIRGARRDAARLGRDARIQEHAIGLVGWRVRNLVAAAGNRRIRAYLALIAQTLTLQWWESEALVKVATLVWADPLFLSTRDATLLERIDGQARLDASRAARLTLQAAGLRRRYRRYFRYQAVNTSPSNMH